VTPGVQARYLKLKTMNTYLLEYRYYQGQHTYCDLGQEKDFPPVNWATCKGRINVTADTLQQAIDKLRDHVWDNAQRSDRYSETQWRVTKDKIYIDEVYETI